MRILRHVNVRNSKEQVCCFQYANKRRCLLPGNSFCCAWRCFEKDDSLKEDIHRPSLVEAKACENVREKFAVALKQNRTMINGGKSKYITNLGTQNYRVLHLAYNPRRACSLRLYAHFVKPNNSSASVCNILLGNALQTTLWVTRSCFIRFNRFDDQRLR